MQDDHTSGERPKDSPLDRWVDGRLGSIELIDKMLRALGIDPPRDR